MLSQNKSEKRGKGEENPYAHVHLNKPHFLLKLGRSHDVLWPAVAYQVLISLPKSSKVPGKHNFPQGSPMFVQRKYLRGKRRQADLVSRVEMPSVFLRHFMNSAATIGWTWGRSFKQEWFESERVVFNNCIGATSSPWISQWTRVYGPCCDLNPTPPLIHMLKT